MSKIKLKDKQHITWHDQGIAPSSRLPIQPIRYGQYEKNRK
jgi:hypothetical protein